MTGPVRGGAHVGRVHGRQRCNRADEALHGRCHCCRIAAVLGSPLRDPLLQRDGIPGRSGARVLPLADQRDDGAEVKVRGEHRGILATQYVYYCLVLKEPDEDTPGHIVVPLEFAGSQTDAYGEPFLAVFLRGLLLYDLTSRHQLQDDNRNDLVTQSDFDDIHAFMTNRLSVKSVVVFLPQFSGRQPGTDARPVCMTTVYPGSGSTGAETGSTGAETGSTGAQKGRLDGFLPRWRDEYGTDGEGAGYWLARDQTRDHTGKGGASAVTPMSVSALSILSTAHGRHRLTARAGNDG